MKTDIRFFDYCKSVFTKGYYQLTASLTTNIEEKEHRVYSTEEYHITMSEKRFTMQEDIVYSCYPPIGSSGDYGNTLPHVVLNYASTPWDYGFDYNHYRFPGLALLVTKLDEGVIESSLSVGQVSMVDTHIFVSETMKRTLEDVEKEDDMCHVIDIPIKLFLRICPTMEELSLLTHVREVKLDYKETDSLVKNGLFSCICANRYPYSPSDEQQEIEHYAYLVGLNEYRALLDGTLQASVLSNYEYIRVLCYKKWNFKTTKQPYDFLSVAKKIQCTTVKQTIPNTVQEEHLLQVLKKGYHPLNHDLRDGSKTVSFYRGPLLAINKTPSVPHYHIYADELYFCDPSTGLLDVSYACAWRLGRMLCMQNLSLCQKLVIWRMENSRTAAMQQQQSAIVSDMNLDTMQRNEPSIQDVIMQSCIQSVEAYVERKLTI